MIKKIKTYRIVPFWGLLLGALLILSRVSSASPLYFVASKSEFLNLLKGLYAQRAENFYVSFLYPVWDPLEEALWGVESLRCVAPYDFWHQQNYQATALDHTVYFSLTFRTTYTEEKELEEALAPIIARWQNLSPLEKVALVHDWIITHLRYDTSYANYSAFEAFFERRAVCQGYALLAAKMFTLLGIENSLPSGYGNGVPHLWNMVKLCCGDLCTWFHLDITWDDPLPDGQHSYRYFLLSENQILRDHYVEEDCGQAAPLTYQTWQALCTADKDLAPRLLVNSQAHFVSLKKEDSLNLTVSLDTRLSGEGDYFLWVSLPGGEEIWFTLDKGWLISSTPLPAYQGPLISFAPLEILRLPVKDIPAGTYFLYFAVDDQPDGQLNPSGTVSELILFIPN